MDRNTYTLYLAYSVTELPDTSGKNLLNYIRYILENANIKVVESELYTNASTSEIVLPDKPNFYLVLMNEHNLIHNGWLREFELIHSLNKTTDKVIVIIQDDVTTDGKIDFSTAINYFEQKEKSNIPEPATAIKILEHAEALAKKQTLCIIKNNDRFAYSTIAAELNKKLRSTAKKGFSQKAKIYPLLGILFFIILMIMFFLSDFSGVFNFKTNATEQTGNQVTQVPKTARDSMAQAEVVIKQRKLEQDTAADNAAKLSQQKLESLNLAKYRIILENADNKLSANKYIEAKKLFEEALKLLDADYPKLKIEEINELLNAQKYAEMLKNYAILVEGGSFEMGSNDGDKDEQPVHKVTLKTFYISKFEVTVSQYRTFCEATGAPMPAAPSWGWTDNHPIVNVTWDEANEYAKWLGKRLPTEAEWEYAAKGGKHKSSYKYAGSNDLEKVAWHEGNSKNSTQEVARKLPNALGIYDMTGNAWEWCNDWYAENYYAISPELNPKGPETGIKKVLRGGSWFSLAKYCRIPYHSNGKVDFRYSHIGFRVAWDAN
ncbi:MAG TPA: hypothetical protein DCQ31_07510 [Bacteroidales bacterium]|nr:hypothetical protein [Bacteroidales bacterium]